MIGQDSLYESPCLVSIQCKRNSGEISVTSSGVPRPQLTRWGNFSLPDGEISATRWGNFQEIKPVWASLFPEILRICPGKFPDFFLKFQVF
jgi:hypothetical protein